MCRQVISLIFSKIICTWIYLFHCFGFWWHGCTCCSIPINIKNVITSQKPRTKSGLTTVLLIYFNKIMPRVTFILSTLPLYPLCKLFLGKRKTTKHSKVPNYSFPLQNFKSVLTKAGIYYIFKSGILFWRLRWIH